MDRDINRTREKVGIDKLSPEQRKRLFEEFIKHGGQVLTDSKRQKGVILREKRYKTYSDKKAVYEKKESKRELQKRQQKSSVSYKKTYLKNKKYKLIDRIILFFLGIKYGVFNILGGTFSKNFTNFVNKELYNNLLDIHKALSPIVRDNSPIKREILRKSKGSNDLFIEIILRLYNIFNKDELNGLKKIVSSKRNIIEYRYIYILKPLFKKLYIVSHYINEAKIYVEKALLIYQKRKDIDPSITDQMTLHLKFCIESILCNFFHQLHILLCITARKYMPLYSQELDDFLEITEKDKIGYLARIEKKRYFDMLKSRKEILEKRKEILKKEEKEIEIPKHIKRGFPLVESLYKKYTELILYSQSSTVSLLEKNDKMFKTYILIETFENEYSFILTTGKIKFNIDYHEGNKIDIKEDLSNAYIKFNKIREEVEEYIEIMKEIVKTESNPKLTPHQKDILLDSLTKKRISTNRSIRLKTADVMKEIEDILSKVILDYNKEKHLLQNPDERLIFDPKIDGQKYLNSKRVIEAIIDAFLYAATFSFMLKFGELSNGNIYIE